MTSLMSSAMADGSDDSEEYDSEDNSGVMPTPLWCFDACGEISLSRMEECELISFSCEKFSCKKFANNEDKSDHGNGNFEGKSGNGEVENGDDTISKVNPQASTQVALWDFPSDSDYLSWNRDENGESGGNDDNHNNNGHVREKDNGNEDSNHNGSSGEGAAGEGDEGDDDAASYSRHESMSEDGLDDEDDMSEVTTEETFFEVTIGGPDRTAKLPGDPCKPPVGEARERYLHRT
jgi:hypothetical protein